MTPQPVIEIVADAAALARRIAGVIAARISSAPSAFSLCLSGGTTPRRAYELLAADRSLSLSGWHGVHMFWGDERFVPPTHQDSNFRMAREALLSHVPVPAANVHPIPTDCASPQEAATLYEVTLKSFYGGKVIDPQKPLFDVTLLGLGEDGHIASLFPGSKALDERTSWVTAVVGAKPQARVSLTFPALEASREILFMVSGGQKKDALARVLANDQSLPAARLSTRGTIYVFADEAARAA